MLCSLWALAYGFRRSHGPRLRRCTLGERIETLLLLLQVLERLLEAAYSSGRNKTRALQRASQQLNVFRHLWRLSHELRAVLPRAHAHGGALKPTIPGFASRGNQSGATQ